LTNNKVIYIYYGSDVAGGQENAAGVWDSNYQGVYHMSDIPTGAAGDIEDSKNAHDGTSQGGMNAASQVTGKIAGSLNFDNSNDYIDCGDGWMEDPGLSQMTVEAWIYKDAAGDDRVAAKSSSGTGGDPTYLWSLGVADQTVRVRLHSASPWSWDAGSITYTNWWYVAFTYNDNTNELKIYRNNAVTTVSTSGAIGSAANSVLIAENSPVAGASRLFDGRIDEMRFSNLARSQDWMTTAYNNMNNPSGTSGGEEAV
jgi:hypothetical protein